MGKGPKRDATSVTTRPQEKEGKDNRLWSKALRTGGSRQQSSIKQSIEILLIVLYKIAIQSSLRKKDH